MEKQSVLIIGGTTGIGRSITERLVSEGHPVKVIGLSQGSDLSTHDGRNDMMSAIRSYKCPYVVYNSGINVLRRLEDIKYDILHDIFAVNTLGVVSALSAFAKYANAYNEEPGYFRFVLTGSISGRLAQTHSTMYCASKAAAIHACRCAARELGPTTGATVNVVSPGPVDGTHMTEYVKRTVPIMRGMSFEEAERYQMQAIPMRRRVTKDEVAAAVSFLLSPEAAAITGQEIVVSGGI